MRAPKRALAASVLALESFVVLFAGLVARGLDAAGPDGRPGAGSGGTVLAVCAGLALACLAGAGALRTRAGYVIGSALQVAVLATGFWVRGMFFLGAAFGVLWVAALRVGARIERERAAVTPGSAPEP